MAGAELAAAGDDDDADTVGPEDGAAALAFGLAVPHATALVSLHSGTDKGLLTKGDSSIARSLESLKPVRNGQILLIVHTLGGLSISNQSKDWSDFFLVHTLGISNISRTWTLWKRPLLHKTLFQSPSIVPFMRLIKAR